MKDFSTPAELANNRETFKYHAPPNEDVVAAHEGVTESSIAMADAVTRLAPRSAERTLAMRKIAEARMWANAAIALHHDEFTDDDSGNPS